MYVCIDRAWPCDVHIIGRFVYIHLCMYSCICMWGWPCDVHIIGRFLCLHLCVHACMCNMHACICDEYMIGMFASAQSYVCMYVCTCVDGRGSSCHVCLCLYAFLCMHAYIVHTCIHTHTHTLRAGKDILRFHAVYWPAYVHIIYTYIHTYIHTHTHTHCKQARTSFASMLILYTHTYICTHNASRQ